MLQLTQIWNAGGEGGGDFLRQKHNNFMLMFDAQVEKQTLRMEKIPARKTEPRTEP